MASTAGASASDAIFVAVRVRPFSLGERRGDGRSMVSVVDDKMICFDPPSNGGAATAAEGRRMGVRVARNRRYAYDHVFDADAGQEAVFRVTTRPLIDEVVKGLNATVLAYGATGSGKTHTMVGSTAGGAGVMVLAIESLFECMRKATDARFALELSYLEVYNETIRDLLDESGAESAQTGGLALRQDARNGATVCGLTWHAPDAASDVLEMLERGNARRAVGATGANAASSRSHAVLQIRLRRSARAAGVEEEQRRSTLTLIDLAGEAVAVEPGDDRVALAQSAVDRHRPHQLRGRTFERLVAHLEANLCVLTRDDLDRLARHLRVDEHRLRDLKHRAGRAQRLDRAERGDPIPARLKVADDERAV